MKVKKTPDLFFARWIFYILGIATILLLFSCENKLPGPTETVLALQNLRNLATVEYTVTKVVKANDDIAWYKPGDRKILITCEAKIKAGIDLSQLTKEDIHISGKSITLHLPEPKILTVNMPPANVKLAYQEIGFFRDEFSAAERDALVSQAEKQIWAAGESLGIIGQAKLNTQSFLTRFLATLGFEKVFLTYDKPVNGGKTRG